MRSAIVLLLAVVFFGCKAAPNVVGKWTAINPVTDNFGPMGASSEAHLSLSADHTFDLGFASGTWSQSGDTVIMTPSKVAGKAAPADISELKMELSSDGQTLTPVDPHAMNTPYTFKRG